MLLEPRIQYTAPQKLINRLPSAFKPMEPSEEITNWGTEIRIGNSLIKELDLYRAITAYKRALALLPLARKDLKSHIEYNIVLCYFLGNRYGDAIEYYESHSLSEVELSFPALENLLIILYASYHFIGMEDKACAALMLLEKHYPETAKNVLLGTAVREGKFGEIELYAESHPQKEALNGWLQRYHCEALSVRKAQTLNALFPGLGYYYVGQTQSALTSFVLNALFTAAAWQLYDRGHIALGTIVASLEAGWYLGGINGAGLAAKEYNERLYEEYGKEALYELKLFPALQFRCIF